jgi:hypothetical protein
MIGRQKTWQWLLALSTPLGNEAKRVERRKEKEKGNPESRSGEEGAELRGVRGREGGGGGRFGRSVLEKTDWAAAVQQAGGGWSQVGVR